VKIALRKMKSYIPRCLSLPFRRAPSTRQLKAISKSGAFVTAPKHWKGQQGLTLIEPMIMVAIIGILATIAIPDFLRSQEESGQAEAKTNLGTMFVAETSYFGKRIHFCCEHIMIHLNLY
jgi:prepilin-type N-terminal cleavage/methylation domain-containing protein